MTLLQIYLTKIQGVFVIKNKLWVFEILPYCHTVLCKPYVSQARDYFVFEVLKVIVGSVVMSGCGNSVSIKQETWWAPELVWKFSRTDILLSTPAVFHNTQSLSTVFQSLYQLHYPIWIKMWRKLSNTPENKFLKILCSLLY